MNQGEAWHAKESELLYIHQSLLISMQCNQIKNYGFRLAYWNPIRLLWVSPFEIVNSLCLVKSLNSWCKHIAIDSCTKYLTGAFQTVFLAIWTYLFVNIFSLSHIWLCYKFQNDKVKKPHASLTIFSDDLLHTNGWLSFIH